MPIQQKPYQEPPSDHWRDDTTYDERLRIDFLEPLERTRLVNGEVPPEMQVDVLRRLHWYFTVDRRERAPTATLGVAAAGRFHALVAAIMGHIDPATTLEVNDAEISDEVRHVLYAYHGLPRCTPARVIAFDHDQQLLGLSYFVHGEVPAERYLMDGVEVQPAYQKFRGCRYFHRVCLRQRIVWLPAGNARAITMVLNGVAHPIEMRSESDDEDSREHLAVGELAPIRAAFLPGKGGRRRPPIGGLRALKATALRLLARLPWVSARFRNAWVFVDRHENADDNAEHLYRWMRQQHPEINAWFLLDPASPDWRRLEQEGFRLMAPGLGRKLLILNSRHIISSHAEYVYAGLDTAVYGQSMGWRYTFLQHGVTMNDVSQWLGAREFDRFITASPAERASIIGDDSNYPFTDREVALTGFPRHDRLMQLANMRRPSSLRSLLVMPTWRGGAFEERASGCDEHERKRLFAETDYARNWSALLKSPALHEALTIHGWRMVFMPHMNSLPFVDVFDPPVSVEVVSVLRGRIQEALVDADAFLTDYTSVAFDMALLRKPIFYYQFDRAQFFQGGHNWRPGYYDYDRDGFGPVACNEAEFVAQFVEFLQGGAQLLPMYRQRMEQAMPLNDGLACQRTYESILSLTRPYATSASSPFMRAGSG